MTHPTPTDDERAEDDENPPVDDDGSWPLLEEPARDEEPKLDGSADGADDGEITLADVEKAARDDDAGIDAENALVEPRELDDVVATTPPSSAAPRGAHHPSRQRSLPRQSKSELQATRHPFSVRCSPLPHGVHDATTIAPARIIVPEAGGRRILVVIAADDSGAPGEHTGAAQREGKTRKDWLSAHLELGERPVWNRPQTGVSSAAPRLIAPDARDEDAASLTPVSFTIRGRPR